MEESQTTTRSAAGAGPDASSNGGAARPEGGTAATGPARTPGPDSARSQWERARDLDEKGRYEDAASAYCEVARLAGVEPDGLTEDERRERLLLRGDALECAGECYYALRRFEEAEKNYREAAKPYETLAEGYGARCDGVNFAKYRAVAGDQYNNVGYSLFALRRYEAAQTEFRKAIELGFKYPYARHSLATLYWRQGRYEAARREWEEARLFYDERREEAAGKRWVGHFVYFGTLLHEVFGELEKAEKVYEEGRGLNRRNCSIMAGLMNLFLERAECGKARAEYLWKAREMYGLAKAEYGLRLENNPEDLDSLLALGELHLAWKDDEEAEKRFNAARQRNEAERDSVGYTPTGKPHAGLGVLRMREKEYAKAIACFRLALKDECDDLTLRSNLAEAYLRAGQLDDAEREYRDILRQAPGHVESLIGLGEVCLARGETDADAYEEAVSLFTRAVAAADSGAGSKRLRAKERAKVLYGKAYASVQLFENGRPRKDPAALSSALKDLRACFGLDPDHFGAKRALDKIERCVHPNRPQRLLERFGPLVVLAFSAAVFLLAQWSFFFDKARVPLVGVLAQQEKFGPNQYIAVTFSALLVMIASLYLPQVLKLRLGALELQKEKSEIDQIATLGTLGMSKAT